MNDLSTNFLLKLAGLFFFVLFVMVLIAAFVPKQFPLGTIVRVPKNATVSEIATAFTDKHVITSPFLFKVVAVLLNGQGRIAAGDYAFDQPENLWTVVSRLVHNEQGLTPIKVTFPEGVTVQEIGWILLQKIPNFNTPYFEKIAAPYEGYLFPDTYYFYSNTTPDEVFDTMRSNFNKKFQSIVLDISFSGHNPKDIVIMASLLEEEAKNTTDRAIISGILWKRIDEGMPLQVDATLVYLTGKNSVSLDDTKINSPYNTYRNKGLPPAPISNPGLNALRAAAQPVKTPYYYYLSGNDGTMHYATTFAGHQINREKYLHR